MEEIRRLTLRDGEVDEYHKMKDNFESLTDSYIEELDATVRQGFRLDCGMIGFIAGVLIVIFLVFINNMMGN